MRRMNRPQSAPAPREGAEVTNPRSSRVAKIQKPEVNVVRSSRGGVGGKLALSETQQQRSNGASSSSSPRTEYRPRPRTASSANRGVNVGGGVVYSSAEKRAKRAAKSNPKDPAASSALARRQVVNEYMRLHVDPLMQVLITQLLVAQPKDVAVAMMGHLRTITHGGTLSGGSSSVGSQGDVSTRKVSRADRVYMVKQITPLISEMLADVVKARPPSPAEFFVAWLQAKKGIVLDDATEDDDQHEPVSIVKSKYKDAVSFDKQVQLDRQLEKQASHEPERKRSITERRPSEVEKVRRPSEERRPSAVSEKQQRPRSPTSVVPRRQPVETKVILVLGDQGCGKTTLLRALGGDLEPKVRPTVGFKTFDYPHADDKGEADGTTLSFCDVSGKPKSWKQWYGSFCDAHAVLFVVDCSLPLESARLAFDACFRPTSADVSQDERRAMLRGKPILVVANKQDQESAHTADDVAAALDLAQLQEDATESLHVAVCACVGDPQQNSGLFDDRLSKAVDWLSSRVDEESGRIVPELEAQKLLVAQIDKDAQLKKERRVFRKTLRKAFPQGGEEEECLGETEGLDFFAAELGCADAAALPEEAREVAVQCNYQKLALQILGNMHNPINPKKRAALSWDGILAYVQERKDESWRPDVVEQDDLDDPTSMRNRSK